jgi:hypothetical protein
MVGTCNMDKCEMEGKNGHNPAIDTGAWGNIGICEHPLDISGVDFDDKVPYANEVELECTKCTIEAVKFEFGL